MSQLTALAEALKAGKQGGAEAADVIMKAVDASADLALVAESMQAATAILRERAKAQVLSENVLPPPPNVQMHFGGQIGEDVMVVLQEAIAKLECTEAKLNLACTCSAWHRALSHPAFWKTFQLPGFSSSAKMKRFLERQPQRFQRTTCFWISLPQKMNEPNVLLLFQIAPALDELVVYSAYDQPQDADHFVQLMCSTAHHQEMGLERGRATKVQPLGKRLKRLTFNRVWLSIDSYMNLVTECWSGGELDPGGAAAPGERAFVAESWLESVEAITFFNIPPSRQQRETSKQVIHTLKPVEQTACDLIQALPCLKSVRLHNAVSGATCVLNVSDARLDLDPFDRTAYRAYALSLPVIPARKKKRNRFGGDDDIPFIGSGHHNIFKQHIYQVPNFFIYEVPSAAWAGSSTGAGSSSDPLPLEPKSAKGRRVLIPSSIWPDYACTENGGAGWTGVIKTCTSGGVANVHFEDATDERGRPYPDEHLKLADLRPI